MLASLNPGRVHDGRDLADLHGLKVPDFNSLEAFTLRFTDDIPKPRH